MVHMDALNGEQKEKKTVQMTHRDDGAGCATEPRSARFANASKKSHSSSLVRNALRTCGALHMSGFCNINGPANCCRTDTLWARMDNDGSNLGGKNRWSRHSDID